MNRLALTLLTLAGLLLAGAPAALADVEDSWWQTEGRDRRWSMATGVATSFTALHTGLHLGPLVSLEATGDAAYWLHPMVALEPGTSAGVATHLDLCGGGAGQLARIQAGARFELPIHITPYVGASVGYLLFDGDYDDATCSWFSSDTSNPGSLRVDALTVGFEAGIAFRTRYLSILFGHEVMVAPLQQTSATTSGKPSDEMSWGFGTQLLLGWTF